jgi:phosphoribosyl 1,2-cyclic phosphodiesterase
MRIKFWGVRGSIPCPGPQTVKYGGNTACIELRFDDIDRLIIIDAGSGIRELGNYMMANDLPKGHIDTDLFLSHTHWDHIMGFPFFVPLYLPTTNIRVHGPVTHEADTLETIVGGQMTYRYFPVRHVELAAHIEYEHLKEGRFDLGDGIILITKYLNHPILCLGYRFEYKGKVFCTSYDTEPYTNIFCTDPADPSYDEGMAAEGVAVAKEQNQVMEQFLEGADVVVYDAQYTRAEYEDSKAGWGHSSMEYAVEVANRCRVKKMALFHHEPVRTDQQMDALVPDYCRSGEDGGPEIFFAQEGTEIIL